MKNMASESSVFIKDKDIVFTGRIDSESIGKIIMAIKSIDNEDTMNEIHLKDYKREPIRLTISTTGGSVYDTLAFIDVVESCKTPVYTYGYGPVMSAGIFMFLAGVKRFCGKYTTFMHHETSMGINDYSSVLNSKLNELNRIDNILDDILVSKTKVTGKLLKQWYADREVYIDAPTALKLGIAHQIL